MMGSAFPGYLAGVIHVACGEIPDLLEVGTGQLAQGSNGLSLIFPENLDLENGSAQAFGHLGVRRIKIPLVRLSIIIGVIRTGHNSQIYKSVNL